MIDRGNSTVTLLAGGDIGPIVEPTDQFAELLLPVLRQADLRFGQCERMYSERGWRPSYSFRMQGDRLRLPPRMASIWKTAGIDVISVASNNTMDWGPEALLDTIELFRGMGKYVIGGGKDIDEARKPAIVERNGVKIAFLAYCSVLRNGAQAAQGKPGCAPMRARSYYTTEDYQPGTPPRVFTVPFEDDVQALQEDIRKARQQADAVVVSLHWGLHHMPKTICDYQPPVAHAAIDAGADLILGHHAHCIKAVEVYKGKVCFYSVGNFMTTSDGVPIAPANRNYWDLWWYRMDPECNPPQGMYPFAPDARMALIAKAVFSKKGVERVSFLPGFVNPQAQLAVMPPSDPKFEQILDFTEWVSDQFPHNFRVDGDEVVVEAGSA